MTEILERNYVVPLRKGFLKTAPYKRSKKAVKTLREFISKHMKSDNVKIGKELNDLIWIHGIKNPPCKVSVTAVKDKDGKVDVNLEGIKPVKVEEKKPATKKTVKKEAEVKEKVEVASKDQKKEAEVKEKETPKPDDVKPEVKKEAPEVKEKPEQSADQNQN